MYYKNPYYKKIRGSLLMIVSCGHCKEELLEYQKKGKGGLINLYIDRIIRSKFDLRTSSNALLCPNCKEQLASRMIDKKSGKKVYKMHRGQFNTSFK